MTLAPSRARLPRIAAGLAMSRLTLTGLAACAAAALTVSAAAAPQTLGAIDRALANRFGLTAAERNTIADGYETARALSSSAPDGVAAIGAIRINARPETYLRWAEAFADFDRGSSVQASHRLSTPPVASDFRGLTLSDEELRGLARCRLGACAMQLDAASIAQVSGIRWQRSDESARAAGVVRDFMLDVARQYAASGNAGLPHYHDAQRATDVQANLESLLDEEAADRRTPPALLASLRGFPAVPPPSGSTSYLYWTTNAFGLKPTTRLNHTIVYRGSDEIMGVIATKQLYASHYFHGALEMRYVVANPALDESFVLVMVTRTRSDGLTGLTGAVIGGKVRRGALHSLRAYLRFTRDAVERRQRAGGSPAFR